MGCTLQQGPQVMRSAPLRGSVQSAPRGQHHRDQRTGHVLAHPQRPHQRQHRKQIHPGPTTAQRHHHPRHRGHHRSQCSDHPAPVGHRTPADEPRDPAQHQCRQRHHHQGGLEQRPKPLRRRSGRRRCCGHRALRPSTSAHTMSSSILSACSGVARGPPHRNCRERRIPTPTVIRCSDLAPGISAPLAPFNRATSVARRIR